MFARLTDRQFLALYGKLHSAWGAAPYGSPLERDAEDLLCDMEDGRGRLCLSFLMEEDSLASH